MRFGGILCVALAATLFESVAYARTSKNTYRNLRSLIGDSTNDDFQAQRVDKKSEPREERGIDVPGMGEMTSEIVYDVTKIDEVLRDYIARFGHSVTFKSFFTRFEAAEDTKKAARAEAEAAEDTEKAAEADEANEVKAAKAAVLQAIKKGAAKYRNVVQVNRNPHDLKYWEDYVGKAGADVVKTPNDATAADAVNAKFG